MPRRVSLPGADELFRRTRFPEPATEPDAGPHLKAASEPVAAAQPDATARPETAKSTPSNQSTKPSGRVRHDEKITIYVTADELLTLEHTRLTMRALHGVAVDRGRIVREAIHLALQDVAEHGDQSALVRRLREQ